MAIQKVNGIIPKEIVDAVANNGVEEIIGLSIKQDVSQPQKLSRADKKFNALRQKMIAEAFCISKEELATFYADYEAGLNGDTRKNDNRIDKLRRQRGIFRVQRGSNINDKNDTIRNAVTNITTLFLGVIIPNEFITLPIRFAACSIGIGYSVYRYNKRKHGNRCDEFAKQESYEKSLNAFIEDAKRLDQAMYEDREYISDAKKALSRREYNEFRKEYLKEKIEELNIESPFLTDKKIKQKLKDMPSNVNAGFNKSLFAEVVV